MKKKIIGIYEVDPKSSYKRIVKDKKTKLDLWKTRSVPGDKAWSDCTTDGVTLSGNTVSLSEGSLSGYIITPELINYAYGTNYDYYKDVTKIQLIPTASIGEGRIRYYASNDGVTYLEVKKVGSSSTQYDSIFHLPDGKFDIQSNYYTLRIKIILSRVTGDKTSPTISKIKVISN